MSTRPADRAVIQISRPLHARLTTIKREREGRLGRLVTFTEIIDGWRMQSESGLALLDIREEVTPNGPQSA